MADYPKVKLSDNTKKESDAGISADFFVFNGQDYIGHNRFQKDRVSIGKSEDADIRLGSSDIADIHAFVYFKDNQVIVSNQNPGNGLRINGKSIKLAFVNPPDVLDIGPYSIKIKVEHSKNENCLKQNDNSSKSETDSSETGVYEVYRPKPSTHLKSNPSKRDEQIKKVGVDYTNEKNVCSNSSQTDECKDEKRYTLIFEGKIRNDCDIQDVQRKLADFLKVEKKHIQKLFGRKSVVLKKNLSAAAAKKIKYGFDGTGAICVVRESGNTQEIKSCDGIDRHNDVVIGKEVAKDISASEKRESTSDLKSRKKYIVERATHVTTITAGDYEDDDDEDIEASWSLRTRLTDTPIEKRRLTGERHLEIIKFRRDSVEDVSYVGEKSKFKVLNRNRTFTLVEYKRNHRGDFFFQDNFDGKIAETNYGEVSLDTLKKRENIHRKRKGIYRCQIPESGRVIIDDGTNEYLIREVVKRPSPRINAVRPKKMLSWRHMTTAIATHLVFFLFLGIVSVFSAEDPPEPEVRFVKINQEQLAQLGKKAKPPEKPKPPKPKKKPPAVKPKTKPEKVKKNKKQPTKKRPTTRVASAKKHPTSKNAKSTAPSRDPNAGGGFGKGNVSNRDINQTGILSMIGEEVGEMPSTTIAAVTNLDAVASPGAGGKSFKVGGVKGKLGNGRISVPNTSVVKTKGSKQVLRSAGASGKGRVAALEKGAVGQKKVKGLVVKARLTKSVKIRGGMSREAVKRVIDRHMAEVYFCYETALIANPSIMGRMIYEWKIKMDGSVGEVKIKSSSVNSHEMHACIKEAIRSWRFPQPSGTEVVVSYPFVFDIVGF